MSLKWLPNFIPDFMKTYDLFQKMKGRHANTNTAWWTNNSTFIYFRKENRPIKWAYESVTKSFRTGHLERELQMVQLSANRCSCIAILWVSLVSFAAISLYVASQRVIPKASIYFIIDSVPKLFGTPSYIGVPTVSFGVRAQWSIFLL
jgi:hypothetical protein